MINQWPCLESLTVYTGLLQEDEGVWAKRPASSVTMELAARRVRHLVELRLELLERMLMDFTSGVDIYLSVLRDATTSELKESSVSIIVLFT